MGFEEVEAVHHAVVDAEQAPDLLSVLSAVGKTLRRALPESFDQHLVHQERGLAVLTRVVEFLPAQAVVLEQGVCELEGGVDQYSPVSPEQLPVHRAHGGSDYQVRLALPAEFLEERQGILRVHGYVRRYYFRFGKKSGQGPGCSVLA